MRLMVRTVSGKSVIEKDSMSVTDLTLYSTVNEIRVGENEDKYYVIKRVLNTKHDYLYVQVSEAEKRL